MNKRIFFTKTLLLAILIFSPLHSFASEKLERIPSPEEIKYFRVVKREGNTLYGVRLNKIDNVSIENDSNEKLERIPSPEEIKYFRVVKREGNALYGVRLFSKDDFELIDGRLRMVRGQASWYRFKNGFFAASPDYPRGSVLRVKNLNNEKSVDVIVNDFGPNRSIHPDRVIDLDYVAFSEIASPGAGLVSVSVEPISIFGSNFNKQEIDLEKISLDIDSLAAIVIRESNGEIIFEKNSEKVLPIASLTKLVFAKVFLDLDLDWERQVTYRYQDEKYNYEYCEPWESARLRVSDGDVLKIRDLFYSAIIGSANNTVETLVRNSGLSRNEFIEKMNQYVKNLGAVNTKFVEPTGLSIENVSSPKDYAIIAKDIFSDEKLKKISTVNNHSFSTINTKKSFNVKNTNQLLGSSTYQIVGSKTGYLHEAGYCLVTRVKDSEDGFIVINLNSKTRNLSFKDNEDLIKFSLKK